MSDIFNHELDAYDSLDWDVDSRDHRIRAYADSWVSSHATSSTSKKKKKKSKSKAVYHSELLRDIILKEMKDLGAYVYSQGQPHKGYNSDPSIYIKFKDKRIRSLRIGDHKGYQKYKYKWNLRIDCKENYEEVDKGVKRFYYCADEIFKLLKHIRNYYQVIVRNS